MENRISICSIRIKNFRSIRNAYINLDRMNIFVGLNDVGKSNILKALNLFFNNNTDYDTKFDFDKVHENLTNIVTRQTEPLSSHE